MLYTAYIQNGTRRCNLTDNLSNWQVISISGLNPPPAMLNTTYMAGADGAAFNSMKYGERNIVITLSLTAPESAKGLLGYYLPYKGQVDFYFRDNDVNVKISGIVESIEYNAFSDVVEAQISLICLNPWFESVKNTDIRSVPITTAGAGVQNPGELPAGVEMVFTVTNNCNFLKVININTGEVLHLIKAFMAGDVVRVNTRSGQRSVKLTRNGADSDIVSALTLASTFLQIPVGVANFQLDVASYDSAPAASLMFNYTKYYRGV